MDSPHAGDLVTVADGGPELDGLVFETPSRTKTVVAVVDPSRGPVFRTVHPDVLTAREGEGPSDAALKALVRRTPHPGRSTARGGQGAGPGTSGHRRVAMHRTTGK